jgi:hypothetical protein
LDLLVGAKALKTVSLEGLLEKFSSRVSKLPVEFQEVFLDDLETATENRLRILEQSELKLFE